MFQAFPIIVLFGVVAGLVAFGVYFSRIAKAKPQPNAETSVYKPISLSHTRITSAEELDSTYMRIGERRLKSRRGGTPTPIQLLEPGCFKSLQAYVLDRSDRGLRLAVLHPIPPNRVIRIMAERSPPGTEWTEVVVCWCASVKDGFDIGCKFNATVPTNVRLMFG